MKYETLELVYYQPVDFLGAEIPEDEVELDERENRETLRINLDTFQIEDGCVSFVNTEDAGDRRTYIPLTRLERFYLHQPPVFA